MTNLIKIANPTHILQALQWVNNGMSAKLGSVILIHCTHTKGGKLMGSESSAQNKLTCRF